MTQRKKRKIFGRNEIIFLAVVGALIIFFVATKALDIIDCGKLKSISGLELWELEKKFSFGVVTYGTTLEEFKDYDPVMAQRIYADNKSREVSPQMALDIADQMDREISKFKAIEIRNTKLRQSWLKNMQAYTGFAKKIRGWAANPQRMRYDGGKWIDQDLKADAVIGITEVCGQ